MDARNHPGILQRPLPSWPSCMLYLPLFAMEKALHWFQDNTRSLKETLDTEAEPHSANGMQGYFGQGERLMVTKRL